MTSWVVVISLSAAVLAGIVLGWVFWRKYSAKLCEEERKWRKAQVAQLESVKERMKVEIAPVPVCYPELPSVPLAGLLAPPRYLPHWPAASRSITFASLAESGNPQDSVEFMG